MLHLDDLEAEAGCVRLHDLAHLGIERLREHDARSPGRVLGDEARVGGDGEAVVARRIRDVHARELADRRLVLEDRLEDALAHLGLVGRVRGQELASLQDRVDDCRDVVVVDARSEEGELDARVRVLGRELLEMPDELRLGECRRHGQVAGEPDRLGDLLEEVVDRGDTDRREHLVAVTLCEREVAVRHCSATTARYASTSRRSATSVASLSRTFTSQPSP